MAKSHGRLIGGLADQSALQLRWFRTKGSGSDQFTEIEGVTGGFYQPSADDIDCRLLARATNKDNEEQAAFAEWGPLGMDPSVMRDVRSRLDQITSTPSSEVEFDVERASEYDCPRALRLTDSRVLVTGPHKGSTGQLEAAWSSDIRIVLDPSQVTHLLLELPPDGEGNASAATGKHGKPRRIRLRCKSNTERDVIALLVRHFTGERRFCDDEESDDDEEEDEIGVPDKAGGETDTAGQGAENGNEQDKEEKHSVEEDDETKIASEEPARGGAGHEDVGGVVGGSTSADGVKEVEVRTENSGAKEKTDGANPFGPLAEDDHNDDDDSGAEEGEESGGDEQKELHDGAAGDTSRSTNGSSGNAAEMTALRTEMERVRGELETVKRSLSTVRKDKKALQSSLTAAQRSLAETRREMESSQAMVVRLEDRLGKTQGELSSLQRVQKTTQTERDTLRRESERLAESKRSLEESLQAEELRRQRAESRVTELERLLDTQRHQTQAEKDAHKATREALREMEQLRDELERERSDLREAVRIARSREEEADSRAAKLRQDLTAAHAATAAAREAATEAGAAAQTAREAREEAERRRNAEQGRRVEVEKERDGAAAELAQLRQRANRIEEMQEQLRQVQEDRDKSLSERNALKRTNASLRRDMARMLAGGGGGSSKPKRDDASGASEPQAQRLREENDRLKRDLDAARRRPQRPVAADAVGSPRRQVHVPGPVGGGHSGPGGAGEGGVVADLQRLANELADQLNDKEMALEQQRATKELLAERITELQEEVNRLRGEDDPDG